MSEVLRGPVQLTEAELDTVAAGQQSGLVNVSVNDVLSNNNVQVAAPINASVAANVLSVGSTATATSNQGNVTQTI